MLGRIIFLMGVLPLMAMGSSFFDEVTVDGPVAFYRLDEAAGTVAEDSSGNGNAASYAGTNLPELGAAGFTVDGNEGIEMSGIAGDRMHVLVPGVLNPGRTSFTLEALVAVEALGTNQIIFQQKDSGGTGRTLLRVGTSGVVGSFVGGATRNSGAAASAGEAVHVAMVFERTGQAAGGEGEGTLTFYVDGVAEGNFVMSGTSGVEPSDGDFVIGSQKGLNGQYFNGVMDEVVFYDKALSAERVAEHFRSIAESSLITGFRASPFGIEAGQSTVLSWDVTGGVTGLAMDQGVGFLDPEAGMLTVSPTVTMTYTLAAADGARTEEREVTVEVGTVGPFRLNEIMADNVGPLKDEDGDESDWIEVLNLGDILGSLGGWYLTDDASDLTKWSFPEGGVGGDGYLVIFASGKDRVGTDGELHTNFKLSQGGEYLALVEPDGVTVHDGFVGGFPAQYPGVSWGESDGAQGYFVNPSPGAGNGELAAGFVEEDVVASVGRGFFEEAFVVSLTTAAEGAEIYFTRDGSEPTATTGTLYAGPILVATTTTLRAGAFRPREVPLSVMTQSYLFLDDVLDQPGNPVGFPSVWQPSLAADYGMDDSAKVGTRVEIKEALRDLPTLSLVMEVDDWFHNSTNPEVGGIYANSTIARGTAWERKVSAEFFDFPHGQEIQLDAGMRIFGNASRATSRKKHNMRLVFRGAYGASKLVFPLFGESGEDDEVNSYQLRGQNGDSWFHPTANQRTEALYIRDQLARSLQGVMGQAATKQDHIHLYINGLYWGVFNTIERIEGDSMATAYGGNKEDWDVMKASPPTSVVAEDGEATAWQEVVALANAGVASVANFEAIQEKLDLENYIDWLLVNFYNGNSDWDHNNWQAARRRDVDDHFRFFVWDSERTLLGAAVNSTTKNTANRPTGIHQRLRQNREYRMMFADRVQRHFFNGGTLTPGVVESVFDRFVTRLRSPLVAESARWGDAQRAGNPYAVGAEWQAEVDRKKSGYFPNRTATVLSQLRSQNLYPGVEAPTFGQFGGEVTLGYGLVMATSGQEIRYTLDGTDPRGAGALVYADPVVLNEPVIVRARTLEDGVWSAMTTAAFYVGTVPASMENIVMSEVHYHPASDDGGEEFIEVMNVGSQVVDLRGAWFEDGVGFSFEGGINPALWVIAPGERVVLVGNESDVKNVHGDLENVVIGEFSGGLDNGGERVALIAADGSLIDEVAYGDEAPWPMAADGLGYSLVRTEAGDWRRSVGMNGNPGASDAVGFVGVAGLDSDGDGLDDLLEFYLGTDANDPAEGISVVEFEQRVGEWEFRFSERVGADEIRVVVEESIDLVTWSEGEETEFVGRSVTDDALDEVTVRIAGDLEKKFVRLKVVRN
ncbi:MAG: hypothetical protein ACJAQT_004870 [Akkermansiaceae bacterium]|jgi:hypothetical protein